MTSICGGRDEGAVSTGPHWSVSAQDRAASVHSDRRDRPTRKPRGSLGAAQQRREAGGRTVRVTQPPKRPAVVKTPGRSKAATTEAKGSDGWSRSWTGSTCAWPAPRVTPDTAPRAQGRCRVLQVRLRRMTGSYPHATISRTHIRVGRHLCVFSLGGGVCPLAASHGPGGRDIPIGKNEPAAGELSPSVTEGLVSLGGGTDRLQHAACPAALPRRSSALSPGGRDLSMAQGELPGAELRLSPTPPPPAAAAPRVAPGWGTRVPASLRTRRAAGRDSRPARRNRLARIRLASSAPGRRTCRDHDAEQGGRPLGEAAPGRAPARGDGLCGRQRLHEGDQPPPPGAGSCLKASRGPGRL